MREVRKLLKADPSLTHKQLAEQVGLGPATVSRYLKKGTKAASRAKTAPAPSGELAQLVQNLEDAKQALREYLESYLSL